MLVNYPASVVWIVGASMSHMSQVVLSCIQRPIQDSQNWIPVHVNNPGQKHWGRQIRGNLYSILLTLHRIKGQSNEGAFIEDKELQYHHAD